MQFAKYLKENCRWSAHEQFSFKYFPNVAFVREILPRLSGSFDCCRHEWVNKSCSKLCTLDGGI